MCWFSAAANTQNVSGKPKFQLGPTFPPLSAPQASELPTCWLWRDLQVLRDPGGFPHPAAAELPQVEPVQEGRKLQQQGPEALESRERPRQRKEL